MVYVVRLDKKTDGKESRLTEILKKSLAGREFVRIKSVSDFLFKALANQLDEILFAVSMPANGYSPEWYDLIGGLMESPEILKGSKAAVLVDGEGSLFTKSIARKLIFAANHAGCSFPGRPLVEATGDLYNFNTVASIKGVDNLTAYKECLTDLLDRLAEFRLPEFSTRGKTTAQTNAQTEAQGARKKVLAIHAGMRETSNTLMLLDMVKEGLQIDKDDALDYQEISIRNGDIVDCRGCGFDTCKHFGESGECFYGGLMVEQVYPAILACDALVLVCPNYNDSVGANMMAMFNRLTALFYNNSFSEKKLFALIVSGYSGGELLAEQIIGAMNCNKGFQLPPHFAMLETANDPGSIEASEGIVERARIFANEIREALVSC